MLRWLEHHSAALWTAFAFWLLQNFSFFCWIKLPFLTLEGESTSLPLGLWLWVITSFSFVHWSDSGSKDAVPGMATVSFLSAAGQVGVSFGRSCFFSWLHRRSWSICENSSLLMLFSLEKLLCPNMYLNRYTLPPLSALPLPKLTGGKTQPAQIQRKVVPCQVILLPTACKFKRSCIPLPFSCSAL